MKKPKVKEDDYAALASEAETQSEIANGAKANSRTSHYALAQFHMNAVQAHGKALESAPEDKVSSHESKIDAHEEKIQEHLRAAEKAAKTIKSKNGKMTGKPSLSTLQQLVTQAIRDDERWDTDSHGYPEGSPNDWEPYCIDILTPDDDGAMTAVIRTDDGRTCKHGFSFDGASVTMDEGDSTPTTGYYVYTRKPKPASAPQKPKGLVHCRSASTEFEDEPPSEFMWMPGGVSTIVCTVDGKPIRMTVKCDEETAQRVNASLDKWRETYPKQKPFACVEHREEEAALWPEKFVWKDDPEPGVFCSVESWSALGDRNVRGKIHRSFSPSFATDADFGKTEEDDEGIKFFPKGTRGSEDNPAKVTGVAFSVGSLTNMPAFKNILPVRAKQAEPQPGNQQHAETKVKMKVKLIKARGNHAAGTVVELADAEAVSAIASGEAITESEANAIAAREARDAELATMKAERKTQHQETIKAAIVRAKERGAIPPKDDAVQAKSLERLDKGADVELVVELINGMQGKDQTALARRLTQPYREDGVAFDRITSQGVSLQDASRAYVTAREPQNNLIRSGNFKEAFVLAAQAAVAHSDIMSFMRGGGDFALRDTIKAADFTDPDSQIGVLSTGLLLMRNLGFLKNKLAWLPYLTTDLRNEPARFKQPILTRYITPANVLTYVPGVGYTSDAGTIAANTGETETTGTLTKSAPSATDVTVTMDQHKAVELEFHVQKLASTVRNLFAEQLSGQLYSLAETINQFVLAKIFAAAWTGVVTSYTKSLANWDLKSLVDIKAKMTIAKIPDVGRFLLLHTFYHDKILQDAQLVNAKAILSLINKDMTAFESGAIPNIYGLNPLESQLSAANTGVLTSWTDDTNLGATNQVGFAGNMSSMLFVARVPTDYTALAAGMGVPATAQVEIVTEPDSGLSMMIVRYVNHEKASISVRAALMYGAAQGDPRVGIVLKPA